MKGVGLAVAAVVAATVTMPLAFASPPPTNDAPLPPSSAITPGAAVAMYDAAGQSADKACTLGFLATGADGARYAFTAGHCASTGDAVMSYKTEGNWLRVGQFAEHVAEEGTYSPDIAVIRLEAGTPQDTRVLSRRPVEGVTTQLDATDTLCFYGLTSGSVSGPRCGRVWASSLLPGSATVEFGAVSQDGDSGAPVYRIESDGSATAVGILTGGIGTGEGSGTTATLIQPYLEKWNLTLATTPAPAGVKPVQYTR